MLRCVLFGLLAIILVFPGRILFCSPGWLGTRSGSSDSSSHTLELLEATIVRALKCVLKKKKISEAGGMAQLVKVLTTKPQDTQTGRRERTPKGVL